MGEWINVKDELPPIGERFDAWTSSVGRLADYGAFVGSWDDDFRRDVMTVRGITHWMPLPPPPKD